VFGVAPAIVQWAHYGLRLGQNTSLTLNNNNKSIYLFQRIEKNHIHMYTRLYNLEDRPVLPGFCLPETLFLKKHRR